MGSIIGAVSKRLRSYGITSLVSAVAVAGCAMPLRSYDNQQLRQYYEEEFATRDLDPIEGFWRSEHEFGEGTGVVYRTDPARNDGFPFAARTLRFRPRGYLPYAIDMDAVGARLKPSAQAGVYHGQTAMARGRKQFWEDITVRLLDATTMETTVHTSQAILGGNSQRAYLVGPADVLKERLDAVAGHSQSQTPQLRFFSGSGFLVSRSVVATNHHVVENAMSIRCYVAGQECDASVIAVDQDMDLALLRLAKHVPGDVTPLVLGDSSGARQGQQVFALGYQATSVLGAKLSLQAGTIGALTGIGGRSSQLQIGMDVLPGLSGGPLLNRRGCVLGVVTGKLGREYMLYTKDIPSGIAFAMKSELLRPLASSVGELDQLTFECSENREFAPEDLVELVEGAIVRVECVRSSTDESS